MTMEEKIDMIFEAYINAGRTCFVSSEFAFDFAAYLRNRNEKFNTRICYFNNNVAAGVLFTMYEI